MVMNFYKLSIEEAKLLARKSREKRTNYFKLRERVHLFVYRVDKSIVSEDEDGNSDLLVINFWNILFGLLGNVNVSNVYDIGGTNYTMRTSGDINGGSAYIVTGTSTDTATLGDYTIKAGRTTRTTTFYYSELTDHVRITLESTFSATIGEFGIEQLLYDSGGTGRTILLSRTSISTASVAGLRIHVYFKEPFVRNFARIMYGVLANVNADSVVDLSGNSYVALTTGDYTASSLKVGYDVNVVNWSPTLNTTPQPTLIPSGCFVNATRTISYIFTVGFATPSSDTSVPTILLAQSVYDTGSVVHDTLLALIKPTSPITLYAGKTNVIAILLVVS